MASSLANCSAVVTFGKEKEKNFDNRDLIFSSFSTGGSLASTSKPKVVDSKPETPETPEKAGNSEKKQLTASDSENKDTISEKNSAQTTNNEFVLYTVQKGDNFWTIAKKFPGVSNDEIMKLNQIKEASSLRIGQILKILPKA